MKSRIRTQKKSTKEQTPDFSTAPAQPMFQSRSFVVQSKVGEQSIQPTSDLKTQLSRATRFGHNLSKKPPVQSKTAIEPEKQAVQRHKEKEQPEPMKSEQSIQLSLEKRGQPIQRAAGNQKGRFIGKPAAIHLHIDIAEPHLKMGGKGARYNFGKGGGGYDENRMREALNKLEDAGKGKPGYDDCVEWLRDQLRLGAAHEGEDNFLNTNEMWNSRKKKGR